MWSGDALPIPVPCPVPDETNPHEIQIAGSWSQADQQDSLPTNNHCRDILPPIDSMGCINCVTKLVTDAA